MTLPGVCLLQHVDPKWPNGVGVSEIERAMRRCAVGVLALILGVGAGGDDGVSGGTTGTGVSAAAGATFFFAATRISWNFFMMPCLRRIERQVSDGCAPRESHSSTLASLTRT